jgi:hypothetical protein
MHARVCVRTRRPSQHDDRADRFDRFDRVDLLDRTYPYFEYILSSHASSALTISSLSTLGFSVTAVPGRGIAVRRDHSPLVVTGNGVSGSGFVLTGVRGARLLVRSRVRLMLASLGRRLYAPGARVAASSRLSSDTLPRRRAMGGAKGVMGDIWSGFRAFPWNGPAVMPLGMLRETVLPLREWVALGFRDCEVLGPRD